MKSHSYLKSLRYSIIILLILGVFFRFVNLDRKTYWHDEIFTSFWLAGYTVEDVENEVAKGQVISVEELLNYQRLHGDKGLVDTVQAIKDEDPQHPPLYYAIARFWVGLQGLNPVQTRMVSVLISFLVFPCLYWLCLELFDSSLVGWIAMALLAISPFHVLYAQEARQYSLWAVTILLSSASLLRAMRQSTLSNWVIYAVGVSLVLYSHLLSFLLLIGHSFYIAAMSGWRFSKELRCYLLALTAGLITFIPWLIVIDEIGASGWTGNDLSLLTLGQRWLLNVTAVFFDPQVLYKEQLFEVRTRVDPVPLVSINHPLSFLVIPILILVGYAIYFLIRNTPKRTWLLIIVLIGSTGLLLGLPDLIVGGQRSSIARYQIPCLLGIQVAVAYLLTTKITTLSVKVGQQKLWQIVTVVLISLGVVSCAMSAQAQTWWTKYSSYYDPEVAQKINASSSPLVISNSIVRTTGLSYLLDSQVSLLLLGGEEPPLPNFSTNFSDVFLYQSSSEFRDQFEQQPNYKVEPIHLLGQLWRVSLK
ncbi:MULTISPECIES: glycosyltransferase family 39 protein [unclassified Coleofasciculus]|uniref:glycosyltransferase family 39 protein n=1 Tax=unclassified Coleofasciculus TaxID=2692782 RepID=UPI00187FDBD1|nr:MULTISPECIES: glycosyltransferase family 39 protein [unclassified Coleofasciculus]MBE9128426.1 glycosyltransferase family 39 protein [Coleofasciculus sp. LEGE 07081]MBE9149529.1 glycosyltransferase family 39 protein [Coleofasciculus sp. LEGE 07092]